MATPHFQVAELALDIWTSCVPQGFTVGEESAEALLARLISLFADPVSGRLSEELANILLPHGPNEPSLFHKLLRAREGVVHFLFFWKTLSEVARLRPGAQRDGLVSELETLRDEVLRRLQDAPAPDRDDGRRRGAAAAAAADAPGVNAWRRLGVPSTLLLSEAHRAAGMSSQPVFWAQAGELFNMVSAYEWLSMSELTSTFLAWFHEAALWERGHGSGVARPLPRAVSGEGKGEGGLLVRLHIYDVSKVEYVQTMNRILAHEYSPVKFGGAFHTGVEVKGLEWSFGFSGSETRPGVACIQPKSHPQHHYRETVTCGRASVSDEALERIIAQLLEDYPGPDYDILRRNCCHFADDFCQRLGVNGIPSWIHRLARVGAQMSAFVEVALSVRDQVYAAPSRELRPPPRAFAPQPPPLLVAQRQPLAEARTVGHALGAGYSGRGGLPPKTQKFSDPQADMDGMGIYGCPFNPGPL